MYSLTILFVRILSLFRNIFISYGEKEKDTIKLLKSYKIINSGGGIYLEVGHIIYFCLYISSNDTLY